MIAVVFVFAVVPALLGPHSP